jgi:hypothetical protein
MVKKKVVTYFTTISFTFPEGNENIREICRVDMNSPKTRLEEVNKREEERKSKKFRRLWKLVYRVYFKSVFDRWNYK